MSSSVWTVLRVSSRAIANTTVNLMIAITKVFYCVSRRAGDMTWTVPLIVGRGGEEVFRPAHRQGYGFAEKSMRRFGAHWAQLARPEEEHISKPN